MYPGNITVAARMGREVFSEGLFTLANIYAGPCAIYECR
jgi:hypothetical protein